MDAYDTGTAVAVVGMSCRFPQASRIDEFWSNLVSNTDSVTPVPRERFDVDAYYSGTPGTPGRTVSRHGGFLDDPFSFDAGFFGISPAEATALDPQHRLLLPVVWEALEDAGIVPSSLAGTRTGTFIGQATAEYAQGVSLAEHKLSEATGSHLRAMGPGRISFALDLRGPSVCVDTACSSSLVAVHMARQSLLHEESGLAIAGGVNVILSPQDAIAYSQAGMLAPDGRCKFGSASADGFVRSEGVGVVVLKRYEDAVRDGDPVWGVLVGSAVTNDGRGSGLLLQPAVTGQSDMLATAWQDAGVGPADLDYVEAHGTGTPVGDEVELLALSRAVEGHRAPGRALRTGSVKSNIGHAEAAAGIAGLIKTLLIAHHGIVPASLHRGTPQSLLAQDGALLEVVARNEELRKEDDPGSGGRKSRPAFLGVSSFGLSGTNAHVVVAQHPRTPEGPSHRARELPPERPAHLLVLSARSERSLERLALRYADYLGPEGEGRGLPLWDVCAAAALKREAHPYRLWAIGDGHEELSEALRALAQGTPTGDGGFGEGVFGTARRNVFVFPGQGSQWLGMGRSLLASSCAFQRRMRECDAAVREELGWSVTDVLTAEAEAFPERVEVVQPVLWATQVSFAAHLRDMGVGLDGCVGHSMGEVAAAVVSGALSLRAGAAVVCRRSGLMRRVAGQGGMLAAELTGPQAREAARREEGRVCLAAENAPTSVLLAGETDALERTARRLDAEGVFNRFVRVGVASHSPAMDQLTDDLLEELADVRPAFARTPVYSTVRSELLEGPEMDAAYWMANLREPVKFHDTVRMIAKEQDAVFLEVSPHPVLRTALEDTLRDAGARSTVVTTGRRHSDEGRELAKAVGRVFADGGHIDWARWFRGDAPLVPLPAYQWEEEHLRRATRFRSTPAVPVRRLRTFRHQEVVAGVSVHGLSPVPPAVHLAVLHEAAAQQGDGKPFVIKDARVGDAFTAAPESEDLTLEVTLEESPYGGCAAYVHALASTGEPTLALSLSATVQPVLDETPVDFHGRIDAALARCHEYLSLEAFLESSARRGYDIHPPLQAIRKLWRRDGEVVAHLELPDIPEEVAWEACLLPMLAAIPSSASPTASYRPVTFGHVRFHGGLPSDFWVRATFAEGGAQDAAAGCVDGDLARADVCAVRSDGSVIAEFGDLTLKRFDHASAPVRAQVPVRTEPRAPQLAAKLVNAALQAPWSILGALGDALASLDSSAHSATDSRAVAAAPYTVCGAAGATHIPVRQDPPPRPASARALGREERAVEREEGAVEPEERPSGPHPLIQHAARLLAMPPERIDVRRPLRDYGLDSLTATRLRRELQERHGATISLNRLLGGESSERLITVLGEGGKAAPPATART
jgi:acyl transferase domain-containing protein